MPPHHRVRRFGALLIAAFAAFAISRPEAQRRGINIETLRSVAALPAHVAGQFGELTACQQSAAGSYFVFDRRAHSVFTVPSTLESAQKLIEIGTEPGRVLDPTAFDLAPDDTFAVADAPRGQPRIQRFTTSGSSLNGFYLSGRAAPRITLRNVVLNGTGAIEYVGTSVFLSQPELDALIVEYSAAGTVARTFGALRKTGHEGDRDLHLALNAGIVVANPAGGFYFVFFAGVPQFRRYDASGSLVYDRHIEGTELDPFVRALPTTWKRQRTEAGEFPLVLPSVYSAAVDKAGDLWISLAAGVTYVYDASGEKRRVVRFHAAGPVSPAGMSFAPNGRLLVTPGCFAFETG